MKLVWLMGLFAALLCTQAMAQPLDEQGIQAPEVDRNVALENVKLNLAMCAPELDQLKTSGTPEALANAANDPMCRKSILEAQAAGMSREQIISILMGATGVPDPGPGKAAPGGGAAAQDADDD